MSLATLFDLAIRPLLYAGLIALVFVPLELASPLRPRTRRRHRADLLFATVGAVLTQALLFAAAGLTLRFSEVVLAPHGLGLGGPLAGLSPLVTVPLGLLVFELGGYAYHRAAHAFGPLYRLHAVHHSSTDMDWLAGFRQHPVEILLMTLAQNLPLVILGAPLGVHAVVVLLLRLNTIFVHANVRTPDWLGYVVATPRFHHRHHDRDARTANYATLLPVLDRLFGTYAHDASSTFGLRDQPERGFMALLLAPFRRR